MEPLIEISNAIKEGDVTFLVGAGISHPKPSNLPLAGQIVSAVIAAFHKRSSILRQLFRKEDDFKKVLKTLRFEALLQTIHENGGNLAILDLFKSEEPNPLHFFLVKCMSFGNQIITTNFDRLIETAFSGEKLDVCSTNAEFQQAFRKIQSGICQNYLFKVHGSLDNLNSIKATLNQVGQSGIGFANEEGKVQVFDMLVGNRNLVVMGYSGSDDFDIVPRLFYVKSNKKIYWLDHDPVKIFRLKNGDEIEEKENLRLLAKRREVIVVSGHTLEMVKEISGHLFSAPFEYEDDNSAEVAYKNRQVMEFIDQFIDRWTKDNPGMIELVVGLLLYRGNYSKEAQKCWETAEELFREQGNLSGIAHSLTNLSIILTDQMNFEIALNYLDKCEEIYRRTLDQEGLANTYRNRASVYLKLGEWKEALKLFEKSRKAYKQCKKMAGYASIVNSIAQIYTDLGRYKKAMKLFHESNTILRDSGDLVGYAVSLGNSARLLYVQDRLEEAEFVFKISLDILKKLGDLESIAKILNNLGVLYGRQGKFKEAEKVFSEAESYGAQIGDPTVEMDAKLNWGTMLLRQGQLNEALPLLEKGMQLAKKQNVPERYGQALGNIGLSLLDSGKAKEALLYFEEARKVYENLGAGQEMAFSDENLGDACMKLEQIEKARVYYDKAKKSYELLGLIERLEGVTKKMQVQK